jgi:FG-GAP-like repeat
VNKVLVYLLIFFCCITLAFSTALGQETRKMTTFKPEVNGFKFVNSFLSQDILDFRFDGLCGGMSYAALDYFLDHQTIPSQTFRPANGTVLHAFIKGRQSVSTEHNADKWIELLFNPFGARDSEFFRWGIQGFNGGRLEELRHKIDAGQPVPLGLLGPNNGLKGHHQVLAIGYDIGRYEGRFGKFQEDLKIFIYDPNYPNETVTLRPRPNILRYSYDEKPNGSSWLTYFVDNKYSFATPPRVTSPVSSVGLVDSLQINITTGGDDLRGGNDNVSAVVNFRSRPSQTFNNLNNGRQWIGNYSETVQLPLSTPARIDEIVSVDFVTGFTGGLSGDNWNVDRITIRAVSGERSRELFSRSGSPLIRFTGDIHTYHAALSRLFPFATFDSLTMRNNNYMVWRPNEGIWYAKSVTTGITSSQVWGQPNDIPFLRDFDGDGKLDLTIWRPSDGMWWIVPSNGSGQQIREWGGQGDVPVPADYDGDGKADIAIWRRSTATWWIVPSSGSGQQVTQWGIQGDIPVPADYDGDGKTDLAIWRRSTATWYIVLSAGGDQQITQWGEQGDVPVSADYDGDGKVDLAVWRPSNGTWFIIPSSGGNPRIQQWGIQGDIPVIGDFDADRKADLVVWRPSNGTWYIIPSSGGDPRIQQWGRQGDVPVSSIGLMP